MHLPEGHAYAGKLRRLHPGYKVGLALTVIVGCLALDNPWTSTVALLWMCGLTLTVAHVPPRRLLRLLLAEAMFLALSVIGIVLSISLTAPATLPWSWHIGPLWFSSGPAELQLGAAVLLRAMAAVIAMNFLTVTTRTLDMMDLLRRVHVSEFLIDVMTVMYRFIFVLQSTVTLVYTAQECRLGYVNRRRAMQSAALLGSQLFIDALRRTQRLQIALDSRGFNGALRVLPPDYVLDRRWPALIALVASTLWIVSIVP